MIGKHNIYYILLITISTIALIIVVLYIVTRVSILDSFTFDTKTGVIGDTIGGVGNVVVGTISAILIFMSFMAQYQANENQMKILEEEKSSNHMNRQFDKFNNSFEDIKKMLFTLEVRVSTSGRSNSGYTVFGLEAINYFIENPNHLEFNSFISKLTYLMDSIFNLLSFVKLDMDNKENNEFLISEIKSMYIYYLKEATKKIIHIDPSLDYFKQFKDLRAKIESLINP